MQLTDDALTDFRFWLFNERKIRYQDFIDFIDTFKYALIVEWFDSVGIYIKVGYENYGFMLSIHKGDCKKPIISIGCYISRQNAIKESIKLANKNYNTL